MELKDETGATPGQRLYSALLATCHGAKPFIIPRPFSPHIREYKTVLDFEFHAKDSGFQELASNFMSVELGFWIPVVSGIPDSLSRSPDFKAKNSSNSTTKISRIQDSLIWGDHSIYGGQVTRSKTRQLNLL